MSKDSHSFSVSVACEVGVPGAILLQHLCFLQKANVSSGENWQEKWVKRSAASIAKTYPYWSAKQVSAICDNLEKHGYIFSRIQNATKTDRAKSYLLTAKGLHLMGEIPFAQMENGFSKKGNANAEMENDILPNGGMLIKVDCTSFIPSFVEEEKPASRFSSSSENEKSNLEAKKEKTPPPSSAPPPPKKDYGNLCPDCHGAGWHLGRNGRETCETCLGNGLNSERLLHPPFTPVGTIEPQPPKVVRLYDNELPGVTVVDSVPGTYETKREPRETPPQEFRRVNIADEVEKMRNDPTALEGFVIGRKLPRAKFAEYLNEFEAEQMGLKRNYKNETELRLHFLNWSGVHHEIAQKKQSQTNGKGSSLNRAGGDLSNYQKPQLF